MVEIVLQCCCVVVLKCCYEYVAYVVTYIQSVLLNIQYVAYFVIYCICSLCCYSYVAYGIMHMKHNVAHTHVGSHHLP